MQAGLPEAVWRAAAQKGNAHAVVAWLDVHVAQQTVVGVLQEIR